MNNPHRSPVFEPGLSLARRFFEEEVTPLLARLAPGLRYGSALLGDGSEVLGYDTAISTDHEWGPRLLLFLSEEDFPAHAVTIVAALDQALPEYFNGWPTRFPDQDRPVGVDLDGRAACSAGHGVEVHTVRGWARRQLGADVGDRKPTAAEWLALDEQLLLSVTEGAVFRDDLEELQPFRRSLAWFPRDIQLLKMARLWENAAAEMPFVGRAGDVGDDIGSRLICARLAEVVMRLCFLIDERYAPYTKWFGSAWSKLPSAVDLAPHLVAALQADAWQTREAALGAAFMSLGQHQLEADIPGAIDPVLKSYFSRPYTVVNADAMAGALRKAIRDPLLRGVREEGH
jgi:hypothetical protein